MFTVKVLWLLNGFQRLNIKLVNIGFTSTDETPGSNERKIKFYLYSKMYSKWRVSFLVTLFSQKCFFSAYFGDLKLKYCPKQVKNIYEHADLIQ